MTEWADWKGKLNRAAPTFQVDSSETPVETLSFLFGEFCNLSGSVLDVGSGPRKAPYLANVENIVCLDPLTNRLDHLDLIRGVGEYLPFKDSAFDHAIAGTSLDHCAKPELVIKEMSRVATTVHVWVNCYRHNGKIDKPKPNFPRRHVSSMFYKVRKYGIGSIISVMQTRIRARLTSLVTLWPHKLNTTSDPYHLHHFQETELIKLFRSANLSIEKQLRMGDGSIGLTGKRAISRRFKSN